MRQIVLAQRHKSTLGASHTAVGAIGARNEVAGSSKHNKPTTINMTAT